MKSISKIFATAITTIAILAACTKPAPTSYTVTGILPDSSLNGTEVALRENLERKVIATTTIEGNKFTFEGVADTVKLCAAYVKTQKARIYCDFILENGNITLDFTTDNAVPGGTEYNKTFSEILAFCNTDITPDNVKTEGTKWFTKHNNDIIGIALFGTPIYHLLDTDTRISIIEGMGGNIKELNFIKDEYTSLKAQKATAVGQPFVDFSGSDAEGNPVKLSDYVGKGNYVLVDMWASWCGPCKREIPNLAEVYNLYKDKGLTVLGVFVWDEVKNLQPTLEAENVSWPQIIDSEKCATKLYGVNGIPAIMLIGPDGTILERGNAVRGANMKPTIEKFLLK